MAFKMTRPTIEGSPMHKEATSVVSQSRTQADPTLVAAADELGKTYIPGAIDYRLKYSPDLQFSKKKKERKDEAGPGTGTYEEYLDDVKGKPGDEGVLSREDWIDLNRENIKGRTPENQRRKAALADQYEDPFAERYTDIRETANVANERENNTEQENNIEQETISTYGNVFQGNPGDPYSYRRTPDGGYEFKKEGQEWKRATTQGAIDAIAERDPKKKSSAAQLRNDRIYRNAIPDGKIRKRLIENGYDPYK